MQELHLERTSLYLPGELRRLTSWVSGRGQRGRPRQWWRACPLPEPRWESQLRERTRERPAVPRRARAQPMGRWAREGAEALAGHRRGRLRTCRTDTKGHLRYFPVSPRVSGTTPGQCVRRVLRRMSSQRVVEFCCSSCCSTPNQLSCRLRVAASKFLLITQFPTRIIKPIITCQ